MWLLSLQVIRHRGAPSATVKEWWHRKTEGSGKEVKWTILRAFSSPLLKKPLQCFLIQWRMQLHESDTESCYEWMTAHRVRLWSFYAGMIRVPGLELVLEIKKVDCRATQSPQFFRDSLCVRLTQTPTSSAAHWTGIRGGLRREGW